MNFCHRRSDGRASQFLKPSLTKTPSTKTPSSREVPGIETPKNQAPNTQEIPSSKLQTAARASSLELGASLEFGAWCLGPGASLELGVWSLLPGIPFDGACCLKRAEFKRGSGNPLSATRLKEPLPCPSCICENLQENGMLHPAVHKGHLSTARFEGGNRTLAFGIMPLSMTPAFLNPSTSSTCRCEIKLRVSFGSRISPGTSLMKTSRLALSPNGGLCGGHVRITVVGLAIFTPRRGADDRRDAPPDALAQRLGIHLHHFADKTDVEVFAVRPFQEQLSAPEISVPENPRALPPSALMVLTISGLISRDNTRSTTLTVASSVTRMPLDEIGFEPSEVRGAGDGLAAAVHDDRVDADGFEEHDIARHAVAHLWIGRIHETAAIFHHERLAAEPLDVGQRFQQRRGFGNEILHRV